MAAVSGPRCPPSKSASFSRASCLSARENTASIKPDGGSRFFADGNRWQLHLPDQRGDLRHLLGLQLRPFFELLLESSVELLVNVELRLGRPVVRIFDRATKRVERLVEHVRESEVALGTLHVHLD